MTLSGNMRSIILITSAAVASAMCLGVGQAQASHVACGDTITADTALDSDLLDCPSNGIVIGADDITLDLNGHRIDGDGTEFADCPKNEICDVGVVNDRHDGVKVKGGSTREFGVGVLVSRSRDNRVVGISSSKNVFFGAVVAGSSRSLVRDSSLSNNIAPEGDGIGLFGSDRIEIVDNSIQHNPGPGIHVDDSTHNLIKGNLISHSGPGILIEADRNEVRGNRFVRNHAGVIVAHGSRNVITRNHLSRDGGGIGIEKARHNLVARNVVVDPRHKGISLGIDFADGSSIGGVDNIVRRNVVRGSGGDGFLVNAKGTSVLRRNVAVGARDDGFDIESQTATLAGNQALRNGDRGIDAVRGVVDGGGNEAGGNGHQPQCRHIACKPAGAAAVAVSTGRAEGSHVNCGDTITADTTLDADLVNCADNGIVIGADNVTLDLNGHTVDGDNKLVRPCPDNEFCDFGVINEGHNGVIIAGGTVRQFGTGVGLFAASKGSLRGLSAVQSIFNGVLIVQSARIRVERNSVTRNGLTKDYPGLALIESHDNRITHNTLSGNADLGLWAIDVDHNLIARNTMSRNPELGAIIDGDGNEISRNRLIRNGGGVALTGTGNAITRNRVIQPEIAGISLEGGGDNLVARNTISGAGREGILLGFHFAEHGEGNRVIANNVRGAGRDGLRVAKNAIDTLLERNSVSGSGDDGIDVRRAATKLTGNHASHNRDLGIEAVTGVSDGGGNKASGNGNETECTHVACG